MPGLQVKVTATSFRVMDHEHQVLRSAARIAAAGQGLPWGVGFVHAFQTFDRLDVTSVHHWQNEPLTE